MSQTLVQFLACYSSLRAINHGCPHASNASSKKCACPKYIDGTLPGRSGRFRVSAKTKSWEQAELLARKYERSALSGEEVKIAKTLPTVKEAVAAYIGDARARGLAVATIQKLRISSSRSCSASARSVKSPSCTN